MERSKPDESSRSRLDPDAMRAAELLAAGLTDAAVARQEGIDERTVRRRVAALMEALEARTRFQAGYRFCAQYGAAAQEDETT